jgi:hypothetical protein
VSRVQGLEVWVCKDVRAKHEEPSTIALMSDTRSEARFFCPEVQVAQTWLCDHSWALVLMMMIINIIIINTRAHGPPGPQDRKSEPQSVCLTSGLSC